MADLGIARIGQTGLNGTLTRADLADVVHRNLGLSRAESASFVERLLHHMGCVQGGKWKRHRACLYAFRSFWPAGNGVFPCSAPTGPPGILKNE